MRYLVLILITPLTACLGLLVGAYIAMTLGMTLYGNYEYFSPEGAGSGRTVGRILFYGSGLAGALAPWLCYGAYRWRIRR